MADLEVITSALRNEASKWRSLADLVAPIKSSVDDKTLDATAFFVGDYNTALHADAYRAYQSFMAGILGQAAVEFDQVGDALTKIADRYDEADEVADLDLNSIFTA